VYHDLGCCRDPPDKPSGIGLSSQNLSGFCRLAGPCRANFQPPGMVGLSCEFWRNALLVLLGPSFDGTNESVQRLASATGLVAYDLRSRIKPGWWGVIRAVGDAEQARQLAARLRKDGFPVVAVDVTAAMDPERRDVRLKGARLETAELVLVVREREMQIPYAAILALVRGEMGSGLHAALSRVARPSSSTFRAVVPSSVDLQAHRDHGIEEYQALDLHFHTAKWFGRVDARAFDFSFLAGATGHPLRDLDLLAEELSRRSGVRVDKGARMSSLASHALQGQRRITPAPGRAPEVFLDVFDGYSRLIAEAELEAFRHRGG